MTCYFLCKSRLHKYTWVLHISNTLIYISCSARAHITKARWETTLPMTSWAQTQEDPTVATTAALRWIEVGVATWHFSHFNFSFIKIRVYSFVDDLWWISKNCGALCSIVAKYAGFVSIWAHFGGSQSREASKTANSKKTELNSLVNSRIYVPTWS
jgi:hypothetical protein